VGNLLHVGNFVVKDKTRDDQRLLILQPDQRLRAPRDESRDRESEQLHAVLIVGLRNLGLYQQLDIVATHDRRERLDRRAKLLERHGGVGVRRNRDRDRAGAQGLCGLAGVGEQVWLSKGFSQVVRLEKLEEGLVRDCRILRRQSVGQSRGKQQRNQFSSGR